MYYLAWYIWSKTFRSKPWTWKRQRSSILTAYADNFYLQLLHLSKKGARYRSLKHTTAIICPPGASVRPKHWLETSDSCMHIQEPIVREKTLGHQRRKQLNTWTSKKKTVNYLFLHLLILLTLENLYAREFLQGGFRYRSSSVQNHPKKEEKY